MLFECLPRVREYARMRNLDVRLSSLQWGVADTAGDLHETVQLCLEEVQRCRQSSAGVYFLVRPP